jgi:DNA-directed RNA polymerase subunit RPC12/RpoP
MGLKCLFRHKWNGCKCGRCGKINNNKHIWGKIEHAPNMYKCKQCDATLRLTKQELYPERCPHCNGSSISGRLEGCRIVYHNIDCFACYGSGEVDIIFYTYCITYLNGTQRMFKHQRQVIGNMEKIPQATIPTSNTE